MVLHWGSDRMHWTFVSPSLGRHFFSVKNLQRAQHPLFWLLLLVRACTNEVKDQFCLSFLSVSWFVCQFVSLLSVKIFFVRLKKRQCHGLSTNSLTYTTVMFPCSQQQLFHGHTNSAVCWRWNSVCVRHVTCVTSGINEDGNCPLQQQSGGWPYLSSKVYVQSTNPLSIYANGSNEFTKIVSSHWVSQLI